MAGRVPLPIPSQIHPHSPQHPPQNTLNPNSSSISIKLAPPLLPHGFGAIHASRFGPTLDRISPRALLAALDTDITLCIKAFRSLSSTNTVPANHNSRLRLALTQLRSCFDKYRSRVDPVEFLPRCVEAGEALLELRGLHKIAQSECFAPSIDSLNALQASNPRIPSHSYLKKSLPQILQKHKQLQPLKHQPDTHEHAAPDATTRNTDALEHHPAPQQQQLPLSQKSPLYYRALMGKLISLFLDALEIDPGLKGSTSASLVLATIQEFTDTAEETRKSSNLLWCAYQSTHHVVGMCSELAKAGWTSKIIPHMTWTIHFLEKTHELSGLKCVRWRSECYKKLFDYHIELGDIDAAEDVALRASSKLNHLRASIPLQPLPETGLGTQELDFALWETNMILFACEMMRVTLGRSAEQMVMQRVALAGALPLGAFPPPILKPRVVPDSRMLAAAQSIHQTRARNKNSHLEVMDMTLFDVPTPSRYGTSQPIFPYHHHHQKQSMKDGTHGQPKPALSTMRALATAERNKVTDTSITPADQTHDWLHSIRVVTHDKIGHDTDTQTVPLTDTKPHDHHTVTTDTHATNIDTDTDKPTDTDTPKKRPNVKKPRPVEETDDVKTRRLVYSDLHVLIQALGDDRSRLAGIVTSLRVITKMHQRHTMPQTTQEQLVLRETVIARLIDCAFYVVLNMPDAVMGEYSVAEMTEFKGGRRFVFPDIQSLVDRSRAADFYINDLMSLSRSLFYYRQWERLHCVLHISMPATPIDDHLSTQYTLEITLRAAASRFLVTVHSDRRVLFDSRVADHAPTTTTTTDLRSTRFELTDQVRVSVSDLFTAITNCIDNRTFIQTHLHIIFESTVILWNFTEPFIRELKSVNDALLYTSLRRDDTLMNVLEFIHMVYGLFPYEQADIASAISTKYALLLECIGCFSHAVTVLRHTLHHIDTARMWLGECANAVVSTSVDMSFHPSLTRVLDTDTDTVTHANTISLRKQLSASQVGVLCAYYRCIMKQKTMEEETKLRAKETEILKLTQRRVRLQSVSILPSEDKLMKVCGDEPVRRAIYLMTVASIGTSLSVDEKELLFAETMVLLRHAHASEAKLLAVVGETHGKDKPWVPRLVRRTSSSITVSPCTAQPRDPSKSRWYEASCVPVGSYLSRNSVSVIGAGCTVKENPTGITELTLSRLQECMAYDIMITRIERDTVTGTVTSTKSAKIRLIPTCPIPLLLCWAVLSEISHQSRCYRIADEAYHVLSTHFVCSRASDTVLRRLATVEHTGIDHDPVYEIFESAIRYSSPAIIRAFVQGVFTSIDRNRSMSGQNQQLDIGEGTGHNDALYLQLLRLRACRDLLMAAELASTINDASLTLLCALKAYQNVLPFVMLNIPSAFVLHVLMTCHDIVLEHAAAFGNDRIRGLCDFFVPMTYHLVRRLVEFEHYGLASQVSASSIQLISLSAHSSDTRIVNSIAVEQSCLGYVFKPKRLRGNHTKSHYYAEFAYHAKVAVTGDPKRGLTRTRVQFDLLSEFVDVLLSQHSQLVSKLTSSRPDVYASRTGMSNASAVAETVPLKRPVILHRKNLDTQTFLKDIYVHFASCGAETTLQELIRFKKNPRYVEIITRIVEWCMARDMFEQAVRLCTDIEDWIDKRTQTIVLIDHMADEGEMRKDVAIKRRKRNLFSSDKRLLFENAKSTKSIVAAQRQARGAAKPKQDAGSIQETDTTKSKGKKRGDIDVSKRVQSQTQLRGNATKPVVYSGDAITGAVSTKALPNQSSGSVSMENKGTPPGSDGSRPSSRPTSHGSLPSSRPSSSDGSGSKSQSRSNSRANSASPHGSARERGSKEDSDQASFMAQRRKQIQQRHAYFAGMSVHERERKDQAARVLDAQLSLYWHRRRYLRRLRYMLEFEAPWRAQLALLRGTSLYTQLQKDIASCQPNLNDPGDFFDAEWFEYRVCGHRHLSWLSIFRVDTVSNNSANDVDLSYGANGAAADMLQSFIRSVVLSSRDRDWLKVVRASKQLWMSIRLLVRYKRLGIDVWRQNLWRGLRVACEGILDALEQMSLVPANEDAMVSSFVPSSAQPLAKKPYRVGAFPITSLLELKTKTFVGRWVDRFGETRTHVINVNFVADFFFFTLETMHASDKWHQIVKLGKRMQGLFSNACNAYIVPMMEHAAAKIRKDDQSEKTKMSILVPSRESKALDKLTYARKLNAGLLLDRVRSARSGTTPELDMLPVSHAYEDAISSAHQEGDYETFARGALEHGDLLCEEDSVSGACVFWSKCVDALFKQDRAIVSWKSLVGIDFHLNTSLDEQFDAEKALAVVGGVHNAMLAATAIAKIAKFFYFNNHDKRSELVWFAAHMFVAPLLTTMPHPQGYLDYASYTPASVLPFANLFSDKFASNPTTVCDCLIFLINELISGGVHLLAFPLCALLDHLACYRLQSFYLSGRATLFRAEALAHLGKVASSVSKLVSLTKQSSLTAKKEENTDNVFDETDYPIHHGHSLMLRHLLSASFSDRIRVLYPAQFMADYEFTRARVIVSVLETSALGLIQHEHRRTHELFDALDFGITLDGDDDGKEKHSVSEAANAGTSSRDISIISDSKNQSNQQLQHQQLDPESFTSEVLDIIRASVLKIVQQKQFAIKAKFASPLSLEKTCMSRVSFESEGSAGLFLTLVRGFEIIAKTFFVQKRFKNASKWLGSMRNFVDSFVESDQSKRKAKSVLLSWLGSHFLLGCRLLLVRALVSEGLFQSARDLCVEGIEEASSASSTRYGLAFMAQIVRMYRIGNIGSSEHCQVYTKRINKLMKRALSNPMCRIVACEALESISVSAVTEGSQFSIEQVLMDAAQKHRYNFDLVSQLGANLSPGIQRLPFSNMSGSVVAAAFRYFSTKLRFEIVKTPEEAQIDKAEVFHVAKALIHSVFARPLRVSTVTNSRLAFLSGMLFIEAEARLESGDPCRHYLVRNAAQLLKYVIDEKCSAHTGYDHKVIRSALLGLLTLLVQDRSKNKNSARCLYDAARVFRMQRAISHKSSGSIKLSVDDYPISVLQELASYKSLHEAEVSREYFEIHDLLYVDDAAVLDRNRTARSPILYQNDLFDYRGFLDQCATGRSNAQEDLFTDERGQTVLQRIEKLHKLMSEKYAWYSDFCLTHPRGDFSELDVPEGSAVLGWLPVTFHLDDLRDERMKQLLKLAHEIAGDDLSKTIVPDSRIAKLVFYSFKLSTLPPQRVASQGAEGTTATESRSKIAVSASSDPPNNATGNREAPASSESSALPAPADPLMTSASPIEAKEEVQTRPPSGQRAVPRKLTSAPLSREQVTANNEKQTVSVFVSVDIPVEVSSIGKELTRMALASLGQYDLTNDRMHLSLAEAYWSRMLSLIQAALAGTTPIQKVSSDAASFMPPAPVMTTRTLQLVGGLFDVTQTNGCGLLNCPLATTQTTPNTMPHAKPKSPKTPEESLQLSQKDEDEDRSVFVWIAMLLKLTREEGMSQFHVTIAA